MPKFRSSERVVLGAVPAEEMPAQEGTVLEAEGNRMYLVSLDRKYRDGSTDDGLREVHEDQLLEHTEANLRAQGLWVDAKERKTSIRRKR